MHENARVDRSWKKNKVQMEKTLKNKKFFYAIVPDCMHQHMQQSTKSCVTRGSADGNTSTVKPKSLKEPRLKFRHKQLEPFWSHKLLN